jgi:hypothetical protein
MCHINTRNTQDGGVAQLHGAIEIGDVVVSIDDFPLDGLTAVAVNRLLVGIVDADVC